MKSQHENAINFSNNHQSYTEVWFITDNQLQKQPLSNKSWHNNTPIARHTTLSIWTYKHLSHTACKKFITCSTIYKPAQSHTKSHMSSCWECWYCWIYWLTWKCTKIHLKPFAVINFCITNSYLTNLLNNSRCCQCPQKSWNK